jgi:acyl-coenzyme A thioesterase PaaI-like protein
MIFIRLKFKYINQGTSMQGSNNEHAIIRKPQLITSGQFEGWMTWDSDTFENLLGPFCFKVDSDGSSLTAFQPDKRHLNSLGILHGGCLLSFADFSLFTISHHSMKSSTPGVSLTINAEFISPGTLDGIVEARGELLKETGSLAFIRGLLTQRDRTLLSFSGTIKKIRQSPSKTQ